MNGPVLTREAIEWMTWKVKSKKIRISQMKTESKPVLFPTPCPNRQVQPISGL